MKIIVCVFFATIGLLGHDCIGSFQDDAKKYCTTALMEENKNIGIKSRCGVCAVKSYVSFMYDRTHGKEKDAAVHWQNYKKMSELCQKTPMPITYYGGYLLFGGWLYRRTVYPVGKKNFGFINKNIARIAVSMWVFSDKLFSPVDSNKEFLIEKVNDVIDTIHEKSDQLISSVSKLKL